MTSPGGDHHTDTVFETVVTEVGTPRPGRDDHLDLGGLVVDAHLAVAKVDEGAHVAALVEFVDADNLEGGLAEFIDAVGQVDHQDLAAAS